MTRHTSVFVVPVMLLAALAAWEGRKVSRRPNPKCAEIPAATFQKNADTAWRLEP